MDIIPSDLNTYGGEAKRLLEDLQSRNERMFLVTVVFLNTAKNKQELENVVFQTAGIAQKYNCALKRLDYQQEQGLMSSLPLGRNWIPIKRALTTTSTAIFVPFTTQELFMGGESIYYGLNALSNNLIMADRKRLKNPNGLILGTPGSGKSFAAKREITNVFIVTKDDIIICDPEGEYFPLVRAFNGQVIRISPTSHDYINPMDININYADDDDPLSLKSDFILSLCELVVGGKNGLEPVEKTIIDRCVRLVYQDYLSEPVPEKMPILEDLYNLLRKQEEAESQRLATALEIYVNGSLKVFNHRTNVELNNRLVCFDIKDLGKQLKKLGMLIVQDQVWNRVTVNRSAHKSTRYYIDEFHLLLKEEQTAAYSVEIWKRFRKWGGIPTGITQNVKDLLASREIENIFENSDFILMLNQASGDRQILAKQLNISTHQLSYVTNSGEGEGLIFYGNTIIPFKDRFDNIRGHPGRDAETSEPDRQSRKKKMVVAYAAKEQKRYHEKSEVDEKSMEDFREEIKGKTKREQTLKEQKKSKSRLSFEDESKGMIPGSGMARKGANVVSETVSAYGQKKIREDTDDNAALDAVQFDVFYGDHASASAHGHQTWEAYIADSNGSQEVEVTTTREVNRLDVTLTNHNLDAVLRNRMTDKEQEQYDAYNKYYGNRDYLFDLNSIPTGGAGFGYDIPAEALSDPQFAKHFCPGKM